MTDGNFLVLMISAGGFGFLLGIMATKTAESILELISDWKGYQDYKKAKKDFFKEEI